ncbi:hypothetical protein ACFSWE_08645 [Leucobacter albus]|uniref:Uncharacterized protein n=1 Tax=Leucobacter albus TaxID=272210 RepID=A0ABW3TPL0_9MICO
MAKSSFSRVKLNLPGVNQMLREQQPLVDAVGEAIAGNAEGNYEYVANPHRFTARGHTQTADVETAVNDTKTHELLRAVGRSVR